MTKYEKEFRKALEEKGYKKFNPGPFDSDGVVCLYQKFFSDQHGKRYAISIREWAFNRLPEMNAAVMDNYRFEGQVFLTFSENEKPLQIQMYCGWTLQEMEDHAKRLWETGMYKYYERNEEEEE